MFKRLSKRFRMWRERKEMNKIAASIDPDDGAVIKKSDRVLECNRQESSDFEFVSEGGIIKAHDSVAAVAIAKGAFGDNVIKKDCSVHVLKSGKYIIDPQRRYNQELAGKINEKRIEEITRTEEKLRIMKQNATRAGLLGI